ncbi:MAG: leucine--tRNA ligase [Fervidicoccaceae archaeon]
MSSSDFRELLKSLGEKWSRIWEERRLYESDPDPSRPKFFVTAAYPYPNAPLHLGHGLTYTIPDIVARYKRMRGYNVLFPMGFHFTGTPVLTMSEALERGDAELERQFVELHGVPREDLEKLKTPLGMAQYFKEWAERDMKRLLLSIDWRRKFTTVDPEYSAFIRWQFEELKRRGYVVQGTHPVGWCPRHQSPVSMHDTRDDVEPEIVEFTVLFFADVDGGPEYPVATLRPETVFGVTNLWVNPEAPYVVASVGGRRVLLSEEAARKLSYQVEEVEMKGERLRGSELVGKRARNPITGRIVPVLGADFVDPRTGTGIVMSVPAHAPYDYVALLELGELGRIAPISLISLEGYSEIPARDAVERLGITSTRQRNLLDEATKTVYLDEYERGRMRSDLASTIVEALEEQFELARRLSGVSVREARETVVEWTKARGLAAPLYDIANKPVYCRCGAEIIVKVLRDQWFIDYENPEWKERARRALEKIEVVPEEYRPQFFYTIDWLKKKACARSRGLGTKLPWDDKWIIESLSDSTIYMAFYTVISGIRRLGIRPESLTHEFWDYVFLGEGDLGEVSEKTGIPAKALDELRREFLYWYPLDNRHSGKDLVQNHLTFMVFNHVALFPEELWPRRIVVNGHVMVEGEKMSKSRGNFIPLHRALDMAGPDALRLALALAAELGNDANFTRDLLESSVRMLEEAYELLRELAEIARAGGAESSRELDEMLLAAVADVVEQASEAFETYRIRRAAVASVPTMCATVREFLRSGRAVSSRAASIAATTWIKLMAPFAPALAEELWAELGGEGSVFESSWPEASRISRDPIYLMAYHLGRLVVADVNNIARAIGARPSEVEVVVASERKREALPLLIDAARSGASPSDLAKIAARWGSRNPLDAARQVIERIQALPRSLDPVLRENWRREPEAVRIAKAYVEMCTGARVEVVEEEARGAARREPLPLKPALLLR